MTPAQTVNRKIFLKRQAQKILKAEVQDLRFHGALLTYRGQLARRIGPGFDPGLSAWLDAIQSFIDFLNGGEAAQALMKGFSPDHPFAFPLRSGAGNGESTA